MSRATNRQQGSKSQAVRRLFHESISPRLTMPGKWGEGKWFGEHEFKWFKREDEGEYELWLHCPKANGKEKAWRTADEIENDNEVLQQIRETENATTEAPKEDPGKGSGHWWAEPKQKATGAWWDRSNAKREWTEKREKRENEEGPGTRKEWQGSNEEKARKVLYDNKAVMYKGCVTWNQFRILCYKEGQKIEDSAGLAPCFKCPGCKWTSGKQNWSDGESSMERHINTMSENEAEWARSTDPKKRALVMHPGKKWINQTLERDEDFQVHEAELKAAGMGIEDQDGKQEEGGEEPVPSGSKPPKHNPNEGPPRQSWYGKANQKATQYGKGKAAGAAAEVRFEQEAEEEPNEEDWELPTYGEGSFQAWLGTEHNTDGKEDGQASTGGTAGSWGTNQGGWWSPKRQKSPGKNALGWRQPKSGSSSSKNWPQGRW